MQTKLQRNQWVHHKGINGLFSHHQQHLGGAGEFYANLSLVRKLMCRVRGMLMHVFTAQSWKFLFQSMNILYGFLSFIFNVVEFSVTLQTAAAVEGGGGKHICTIQIDYILHILRGFCCCSFYFVKMNIIINILLPIPELPVGRNLKFLGNKPAALTGAKKSGQSKYSS